MIVMSYIEQYLYWTPFNSFQTISERHSKKQYEWLVLGTTKIDFGDDPLFRVNTSQVGIWVVFELDIAILSKIEETLSSLKLKIALWRIKENSILLKKELNCVFIDQTSHIFRVKSSKNLILRKKFTWSWNLTENWSQNIRFEKGVPKRSSSSNCMNS